MNIKNKSILRFLSRSEYTYIHSPRLHLVSMNKKRKTILQFKILYETNFIRTRNELRAHDLSL